ncbi:monocarboxylate transporter 5-like [Dermacentor albipictus]|uniref:monocarboxylate transporter 5-like n=1 Tax=Dermacentor albipictus TaxID=60249 RepID=UPI0031FD112D
MSPTPVSLRRSEGVGQNELPVDKCWGIPVFAALSTLLITLPSCYMALLFVFFVDDYNVSRERASWPQNSLTMATHVSGLLVAALQRRISVANIAILGSLLASLGVIASSFAREVIWMSISLGVMYGLGLGMFMASVAIYILMHFDKYKGTALTLAFIAWGISGLIGPAFLTHLRTIYALDGTLLMTGGLLLHAIPLSMLLKNPRPVNTEVLKSLAPRCPRWMRTRSVDARRGLEVRQHQPPSTVSLSRMNDPVTWRAGKNSNESGPRAFVEAVPAEQVLPARKHSIQQQPSEGVSESSTCASLRGLRRFAATVFRTPAFYVFLVATVAGDYSGVSFSTTIVDYAVDKGIDVGVATHLIELGAVGHLAGRIFIMPLSDWAPMSRLPLFASSYALEAMCALIMPHIGSSFSEVAAVRVVETTVTGFSSAIRGILLAQYMGIDRLASCMGLYGLVMIPVSLGSASIIGFFRDTMGSYDGFYRMLAALNTVVAVVFGMFLVFDWTRARRRGSQSSENSLTQVTIGSGAHSEQRC